MNSDGSNAAQVLVGKQVMTPTWSPDGTKIAFCAIGGPMFVMNADGTNLTELPGEPQLSGDLSICRSLDWGAG